MGVEKWDMPVEKWDMVRMRMRMRRRMRRMAGQATADITVSGCAVTG